MVSDRTFLPFFVITFAVIIYSALAFGPRSNSTESPLGGDPLNGFVIANDDLKIIISGPGISRELIDDPVEGVFIRTAAGQTPNNIDRARTKSSINAKFNQFQFHSYWPHLAGGCT